MRNADSDGWNCVVVLAVLMRLSSFCSCSVGWGLFVKVHLETWGRVAGRRERDSF